MKQLSELVELARLANIAGQGSPEMVDFRVTANPDNILAIAEAFRALEQRAEAAEAKLAELEKEEHYVEVMKDGPMTICHWMKPAEELPDGARLFTRPAPAADLAELVPMEWTNEQCMEFLSIAFRHAEISGDIEMDDIRQAVKMVNAGAKNH